MTCLEPLGADMRRRQFIALFGGCGRSVAARRARSSRRSKLAIPDGRRSNVEDEVLGGQIERIDAHQLDVIAADLYHRISVRGTADCAILVRALREVLHRG